MESPKEEDSAYSSPRSIHCGLPITTSPLPNSITNNNCLRNNLCSIICRICNNAYVNPKVLPCLHTFCASCIETNKFCPECNYEYSTNNGGNQSIQQQPQQEILPDYGIINFIQSMKGSKYCNSCQYDMSQPAIAKCINCDNVLCQNCLLAHSFLQCFEGHRVIEFPKDGLIEENSHLENDELFCSIHLLENVKHFCMICNQPVCKLCICQDHAGHRVELLDNVGDVLMDLMKNSMDEMKNKMKELQLSFKFGTNTSWWLNTQYWDLHKQINDIYDQYCTFLLKHKENQLAILESSYFKMKTSVNANNLVIQEALEKITMLNDFYTRLVKYATKPQCLMFKKILENRQRRLLFNYKPKTINCNLKLVSDAQDFTTILYNNFGHIVHDMNTLDLESLTTNPLDSKLISSNFVAGTTTANNNNNNNVATPSTLNTPKNYMSQFYNQLKYDKWSNTALDDLKSMSDLCLIEDAATIHRPYNSIRSEISRTVITYNWKFGSYGTAQGQFTEPNGVCINAEGDIIIADTNNNRVQVFDKLGRFKFAFGENVLSSVGGNSNGVGGGECSSSNTLLFPNRVAVMELTGDIIVTERAPTHQVQVYNQYGGFLRKFGANILQHPRAVAVDKEGRIIVVECKVMRVIIFDINGTVLHKFTCNGTLHFPNGVAVNDRHEIFISDNRTHCVNVYDYNGTFLRQIGREGLTNYPIGVMLSKDGLVIIADNHNNFNLTVFTQEGQLVNAVESKVKHAQCYDAAISSEGSVVLTSKDYRVYIYLTTF